jgi:hypothetical protein
MSVLLEQFGVRQRLIDNGYLRPAASDSKQPFAKGKYWIKVKPRYGAGLNDSASCPSK